MIGVPEPRLAPREYDTDLKIIEDRATVRKTKAGIGRRILTMSGWIGVFGLVAGFCAGVATGVAARVAMRVVALSSTVSIVPIQTGEEGALVPTPIPMFTIDGTISMIASPAVAGSFFGVTFFTFSRLILYKVPSVWRGLLFGTVTTLLGFGILIEPRELAIGSRSVGVVSFAITFFLFGAVFEAVMNGFEKKWPNVFPKRRERRTVGKLSPAAQAIIVPSFIVCATSPLILPLIAVGGTAAAHWLLHRALWILTPLNLVLIAQGYRLHRDLRPLVLGVFGTLAIFLHLTGHLFDRDIQVLIWSGIAALVSAGILDWRGQRRARERHVEAHKTEYWMSVLRGDNPGLRRGRRLLGALPSDPRCKLCNAPFGGIGGALMRLFNKAPSERNPTFCKTCLTGTPLGGAEVEVTLLFADVRGSTPLAEQMSPADYQRLMSRFYSVASEALVENDALIDKFVGDQVIGLFVPGFAGPSHANKALLAAGAILRSTKDPDSGDPWIDVGVGINTGVAFVGLIGPDIRAADLTALGDAPNVAARLASSAAAGEILMSEHAFIASGAEHEGWERHQLTLKGKSAPLDIRATRVSS